jgi:hypothetical protein
VEHAEDATKVAMTATVKLRMPLTLNSLTDNCSWIPPAT